MGSDVWGPQPRNAVSHRVQVDEGVRRAGAAAGSGQGPASDEQPPQRPPPTVTLQVPQAPSPWVPEQTPTESPLFTQFPAGGVGGGIRLSPVPV